jgi:hypothetical protein
MEQINPLRKQVDELNQTVNRLKSNLRVKEEQYQALHTSYQQQESEINQMRLLSEDRLVQFNVLRTENDELKRERMRLQDSISKLKDGLQNNSPRPSNDPISPRAKSSQPSTPQSNRGVLSDGRLGAYRDAVTKLLDARHSDLKTDVLMAMKLIVLSCKGLTEEVETHESNPVQMSVSDREQLLQLKTQLTSALTNLMNAAKSHATGNNASAATADELEHCANDLSSSVYSIVDLLGLRSAEYQPGSNKTNSISRQVTEKPDMRQNLMGLDDLRLFLEKQTDLIVHAIQTLLLSMKNSTFDASFHESVANITQIVNQLLTVCRGSLEDISDAAPYRNRGFHVLGLLESSNVVLYKLREEMLREPSIKPSKQRIASASYEVAKYTKELVGLLDE